MIYLEIYYTNVKVLMSSIKFGVKDLESFHPHYQNNKFDDFAQAPSCSNVEVRVYHHQSDPDNLNPNKHKAHMEIKVSMLCIGFKMEPNTLYIFSGQRTGSQ